MTGPAVAENQARVFRGTFDRPIVAIIRPSLVGFVGVGPPAVREPVAHGVVTVVLLRQAVDPGFHLRQPVEGIIAVLRVSPFDVVG